MSALLALVGSNALSAGILALAAWTAGRFVRRQAVLHGLWLLALLKLVTPPVLPVPILPAMTTLLPAPAAPLAVVIPPTATAATTEATGAVLGRAIRETAPASLAPRGAAWPANARGSAAAAAFAGGALVEPTSPPASAAGATPLDVARATATAALALGALGVVAVAAHRIRRFRRLLATAVAAPPAVAARTEEIASRLGLPGAPPVLLVPAPVPPMLWPTRRGPVLLLPQQLLGGLTAEERDALLAHELAHVRRRDHWVRVVEIAATALFWWYPVAWWARSALRRAEERCCDEWVLRVLPSAAGAYASGLLKSLAFVSGEADPLPVGASGAGPVHDLEARLKEILMTRPLPRLAAPVRLCLAATALAGLAVFPTHAQSRPAVALGTTDDTPGAAVAPSASADTTPPMVAGRARGRAVARPDVRPLVNPPGVRRPLFRLASGDVTPRPGSGVAAGVPGGLLGGVPGGVSAGILALASSDTDDPALAAERRALEEQRRKLREQEIDLERRTLDLEVRADQKRLTDDVVRLRAEGRTAEAARVEKEVRLNAKRVELQKEHLQLELENTRLEAEMEKAAGEAETPAGEAAAAQLDRSRQALEAKQQALEAEMEKADREMQSLEAEGRVEELRQSTGDLERSLAEHIQSLQEALPEAGAQKADLEREIARLQSALDALGSPSSGRKMRTPAPTQGMKLRQPQPPPPQP